MLLLYYISRTLIYRSYFFRGRNYLLHLIILISLNVTFWSLKPGPIPYQLTVLL
jgi:hypothetical protein